MAKVLVIPDVHLKWQMFKLADKIFDEYKPDYAVQLGDMIDDFNTVEKDYLEFLMYFKEYKNIDKTVFLYGNHDVHGLLARPCSGTRLPISQEISREIDKLTGREKIVHEDGKCIFSHAGVCDYYCEKTPDEINKMHLLNLLEDESPLWCRPQWNHNHIYGYYYDRKQVVGHTPLPNILDNPEMISVDVFSTNVDNSQYGEEKMIIIDTETKEWEKININYRREFLNEKRN